MPPAWPSSLNLGIWLQGASQSGKTALLSKFGKDFYKGYYYLNLEDLNIRAEFESKLKEAFSHCYPNSIPDYDKRYAFAVIREMFPDFIDQPDRMLIIDGVQESPDTFIRRRQIVRGLNVKVAFSTAYFGDIFYSKDRWSSAGDIVAYDLEPVSYREFLKASPACKEVGGLDCFLPERGEGVDQNQKLIELSGELRAYITLGGYPRALAAFLAGDSEKRCIGFRDLDAIKCVLEMAKRTGDISEVGGKTNLFDQMNEYSLWETIVVTIVDCIVKGLSKESLLARAQAIVIENQDKGCMKNRFGDDYSTIVLWMEACKIIRTVRVWDLDFKASHVKYAFGNLGLLQYLGDRILPILADNPEMAFDREDRAEKDDLFEKYREFATENFVFNALADIVKKYQLGRVCCCEADGEKSKVDFFISTQKSVRIAFCITPSIENASLSDKWLKSGKFRYLVKLANKFEWTPGSNVLEIPLCLIAMLPVALKRMRDENFEQLGPCGEYIQPEYEDDFRDVIDDDTELLEEQERLANSTMEFRGSEIFGTPIPLIR
jgi:hypothetical protein